MPEFLRGFGDIRDANGDPALSSGKTSLLASIVQVGELVGSLTAGFVGASFGRRGTLCTACALVTIGAIIQLCTTSSINVYVGGRFVLGMGIGQISNAVPLYLSEVSPSLIRGVVVGSWQLLLAIGQVIGAVIDQGTKDIPSSASYRIPVGLNILIPVIVYSCIWFVPESPRWLVSKHRDEKAVAALIRINASDPNYSPTEDIEDIRADHEASIAEGSGSWGELFTNPVEFRKLVAVFGILAGQQITGVQFIFSYATVIATSLQLANPFVITIIIDIIEVLGVLFGFLVIGRFDRKALILWTSIVMIVSLIIVGGAGSGPQLAPTVPTPALGKLGISFIMVFVFAFNVAWGPLAWAIATEHCPGRNRSKIMGVGTASFWIIAWAVTFTLPYLYSDQGGASWGLKIGYFYAGGCLLSLLFVMFYIGETRGRTLEEINELFAKRVPARKWKGYVTDAETRSADRYQRGLVSEDSPRLVDKKLEPSEERVEDV